MKTSCLYVLLQIVIISSQAVTSLLLMSLTDLSILPKMELQNVHLTFHLVLKALLMFFLIVKI